MTTANMGLTLPDVSVTPGPTWASQINSDLTLIDEHNHTSGFGAQVPVAGLDINDNLPLGGLYGLDDAKFVTLSASSSGVTPDASLFRQSGNLYYKNASGTAVRITNGSSVDAPSNGGFTGLVAPAAAEYGSGTFELWQDNTLGSEVAGALSCGPISLQQATAGAPVLTLTPSASMVSGYTFTFPSAPPGALSLLSISSSGVAGNVAPDNATVEISAGVLRTKYVFQLSASDTGSYSQSIDSINSTEITSLEIPSVSLVASKPVMLMLQASQLNPTQNAFISSQTYSTKLSFVVTPPVGSSFAIGQTQVDTNGLFSPSALSAWFAPTVTGAHKIEVFALGIVGTSTLAMNYCRLSVFQV